MANSGGVYLAPRFLGEYRPARDFSVFSPGGWWLNQWPLLGWLETFLKVAAWCFAAGVRDGQAGWPVAPAQASGTVMVAVLLTAAIVDRLIYREIISMVFVFPNVWAHWVVAWPVAKTAPISHFHYRGFLFLMLLGDLTKLVFFYVHDFNIKRVAKGVLWALVCAFAVAYGILLYIDYLPLPKHHHN